MKLEHIKKIYTEQVAQYIREGWTIDPFIHDPQCETTVVFVRGNVRHVVYMRIQHKAEHIYQESVAVGSAVIGKLLSEDSFILEECQEYREQVFVRIKRKADQFVNPEKFRDIVHKQSVRHAQKNRVGMFREFLGGKHEIPSPEACRTAYKLVRKVKGYGNTPINGILRVWFESGTDGTWHYKPTLCIQVAGKLSEARIPMPCAR